MLNELVPLFLLFNIATISCFYTAFQCDFKTNNGYYELEEMPLNMDKLIFSKDKANVIAFENKNELDQVINLIKHAIHELKEEGRENEFDDITAFMTFVKEYRKQNYKQFLYERLVDFYNNYRPSLFGAGTSNYIIYVWLKVLKTNEKLFDYLGIAAAKDGHKDSILENLDYNFQPTHIAGFIKFKIKPDIQGGFTYQGVLIVDPILLIDPMVVLDDGKLEPYTDFSYNQKYTYNFFKFYDNDKYVIAKRGYTKDFLKTNEMSVIDNVIYYTERSYCSFAETTIKRQILFREKCLQTQTDTKNIYISICFNLDKPKVATIETIHRFVKTTQPIDMTNEITLQDLWQANKDKNDIIPKYSQIKNIIGKHNNMYEMIEDMLTIDRDEDFMKYFKKLGEAINEIKTEFENQIDPTVIKHETCDQRFDDDFADDEEYEDEKSDQSSERKDVQNENRLNAKCCGVSDAKRDEQTESISDAKSCGVSEANKDAITDVKRGGLIEKKKKKKRHLPAPKLGKMLHKFSCFWGGHNKNPTKDEKDSTKDGK